MANAHPENEVRVFFSDGILCEGFIWKYAWEQMAELAPLVHWNYRGHGRSFPPKDPDRIGTSALADDLMAVRQHVGNPPCVLVGHSMGCQVALENAHRHPEGVRGLILVCGTYGKLTRTIRGLPVVDWVLPKLVDFATKRAPFVNALWSRIPPEMAFQLALRTGDLDANRVRAEDVVPYFREMGNMDISLFVRMLKEAGAHSAESYMPDLKIPALIIAGEKDMLTPAVLSEAMASLLPNAELFVVPNGTHVAPIEQPEAVGLRITEWWKKHIAP